MMPDAIPLQIICHHPPPAELNGQAAEFGLQDKKQQVHPGLALPDGSLQFDLTVQIKRRDDQPDFAGSWVQGPPGQRFIYLSYRLAAADSPWIKRIKLPLAALDWTAIRTVAPSGVLQVKVDGRAAATIRLTLEDWQPVNNH